MRSATRSVEREPHLLPSALSAASSIRATATAGLQLLGHRYYDPSIGRFLSQDPIQDGTNWYAYCDNNPLEKIDPDGFAAAVKKPWKPKKKYPSPKPIKNYPPNEGFDGPPTIVTLPVNTPIDHFGPIPTPTNPDTGRYITDPGMPPWDISLPPDSPGWQIGGQRYIVKKPITGVKKGPAAPWDWGKNNPNLNPKPHKDQDPGKGGGIQYKLPRSIDDLIKDGSIIPG